jgi:hypothetical protein
MLPAGQIRNRKGHIQFILYRCGSIMLQYRGEMSR